MEQISRWAHESMVARLERIVHRLIFVIVLLIVLLVGTNGAWLWYESQFEEITIRQENEDGYNNFIGHDGDITN